MKETPLLEAIDLTIGYRSKALTAPLSLTLRRGELTALIGRNGAGKSTLLRTLTGELKPISGQVLLLGRPFADHSRKQRAAVIAIVTTDPLQVGALTVEELVALGRDPHTGLTGRLEEADRRAIAEAMKAVGISHKKGEFVACLSDGERQKALIARALAQDTPLIILDEPFSFLDVAARIDILRTLRRLSSEQGKCILFSSHDVSQALRMAERVCMFTADGSFLASTAEQLITSGEINELFDNDGVRFDPSQTDFVAR